MSQLFNVYCDESCHLEGDHIPVMVLGAVWCPQAISGKIAQDIRAIKVRHGLKPDFEGRRAVGWGEVRTPTIEAEPATSFLATGSTVLFTPGE
jgi:hypothetical protein